MTSGEAQVTVVGLAGVTGTSSVVIQSPGQSGSMSFIVTGNGGYTGTATLACTPDAQAKESTCTVKSGSTSGSSIQVDLSGGSVPATVTVGTTAAHSAALTGAPNPFGMSGRIAVAGLVLLLMPWTRRKGRVLLGAVMLALALGISACGGGGAAAAVAVAEAAIRTRERRQVRTPSSSR